MRGERLRRLGPRGQADGRVQCAFTCPLPPLLQQVWTSVPYLASYVSPVLKENKAIPLSPHSLEVLWNGK